MRPRCASAGRSAARVRSRPGSGASCQRLCSDVRRGDPAISRLPQAAANGRPDMTWSCGGPRSTTRSQRTAVFLRYDVDLDYAAIGEALGIMNRDRCRNPQCRARGATHPPGGGTNVTELDRDGLSPSSPPPPRAPHWDYAPSRSGARQRRRRRLVAVAATALVVAVGLALLSACARLRPPHWLHRPASDRSDAERPRAESSKI